jgi:hypothetical protein
MDAAKAAIEEPKASSPADRLKALAEAHRRGIKAVVSNEPIWSLEDSLGVIEAVKGIADVIKFGPLNHDERRKSIDYPSICPKIRDAIIESGMKYLLKRDFLEFIPVTETTAVVGPVVASETTTTASEVIMETTEAETVQEEPVRDLIAERFRNYEWNKRGRKSKITIIQEEQIRNMCEERNRMKQEGLKPKPTWKEMGEAVGKPMQTCFEWAKKKGLA